MIWTSMRSSVPYHEECHFGKLQRAIKTASLDILSGVFDLIWMLKEVGIMAEFSLERVLVEGCEVLVTSKIIK
jgi:hypothetical protein